MCNYFNPCCARPSNAHFVIFFTFTVYFNPCNARPSNARFVIFCMFTVADAARRHGLRTACGCVPRRYARSVVPPLVKKSRSARLFAYKCAHNASLSLPTFCRFKRLGLSHKTNIRIQKIPPGLPCGIFLRLHNRRTCLKTKFLLARSRRQPLSLPLAAPGGILALFSSADVLPVRHHLRVFFTLRTLGGVRRQSKEISVCPARDL